MKSLPVENCFGSALSFLCPVRLQLRDHPGLAADTAASASHSDPMAQINHVAWYHSGCHASDINSSIAFRASRPVPLMLTKCSCESGSSASESFGLMRISFAFAPPSSKTCRICSEVCRTVGTRPPAPISNKTQRRPVPSATNSPSTCIQWFQRVSCCCESNQSRSPHSPNISTAGRAAAPHRAHLGWLPQVDEAKPPWISKKMRTSFSKERKSN